MPVVWLAQHELYSVFFFFLFFFFLFFLFFFFAGQSSKAFPLAAFQFFCCSSVNSLTASLRPWANNALTFDCTSRRFSSVRDSRSLRTFPCMVRETSRICFRCSLVNFRTLESSFRISIQEPEVYWISI